ncbi:MAG: hypothetical protein DBX60_01115 [Bacillota bacterium]|nr:MAG: hypothetical protein DBX60_01115 [Bacillota bacterium]
MALAIEKMNFRKTKLIYIILFLLIFMNKLTTIYVFSQMDFLGTVIDFVQVPMYGGLIYIIAQKEYSLKELMVFLVVGILLLIGYIVSGQAAYFKGFLLIIASKNIPYRKILNVCRKALTFVLGLGVFLFVIGISNSGLSRRGVSGLGFGHPNVTAQLLMIIILLWVSEKAGKLKPIHYIGIELSGLITFLLTDSKTSTIVIFSIPFVMVFSEKIMSRTWYSKVPKFLMTYSQLLVMLFTYLSARFLETSSILKTLDLVFTNRLFLNYYALNKFGIKLFGQNVTLSDNSGTIYNNIHGWYNWSVTCDCSYMATLLVMGFIPTVIILIGYILLMKKAIKRHNYMIMSVALLLAIYSFCESQMLEVYSSFVYFYLIADDIVLDNSKV